MAPANGEAFAGLWPGNFGGNMDAPEVREGTTVYLPIFNDGAYFYFGDGHARQGEGEVKWDAYVLVGQLSESTVANIVDPAYTVVAKFPKEYLPR